MKTAQLAMLRFFSLLFLLPGLAGLILSSVISTYYLENMPRSPDPEQLRIVPRGIHGIDVYQTVEEDRRLRIVEDSSVGVFLVGLGLGLVYLEKWGGARSREAEQDDELTDTPS
ncbi:MAG: hypothetical protein P4K86_00265 [Terracidiphilus sp.]|nr:hypothetical protein [Terracidiphilus sp.]MDR3775417.1 hypothetical protein [Terracidiphilus sp.]